MAPRGVSWRRPYTSIYNENYQYGTKLYSNTLSDIEKRYTDSLSRTQVKSDRPDLTLSTFAGSNLRSSPMPAVGAESNPVIPTPSLPTSPTKDLTSANYHGAIFETMLNSALHSSYATDIPEEKTVERRPVAREPDVIVSAPRPTEKTRPTSLYDDAVLFTPMKKITETKSSELDESSSLKRKKKIFKESSSASTAAITTQNGPQNPTYLKDQCRDLQSQVDFLTQAMAEISNKLKAEMSNVKSKLNTEVNEMHVSLEQSSQQCNELQKTVKRQANQLMELQTAYEDLQRHLQDSQDEVSGWQRRSQTLRNEMDRLRGEIELTLERSKKTTSA